MIQEPTQDSASHSVITAQGVFGLPQGCRVVLKRTMPDLMLQSIAAAVPVVAGAMETIDGQTAVLVTANANLVEIRFDNTITLPAYGGRPAVSCENVWARLHRLNNGLFEFSTSAANLDTQGPPLSYSLAGLTAVSERSTIIFYADGEPRLRVAPSTGSEIAVSIEVFCAPYLSSVPIFLRSFVPDTMSLVNVMQVTMAV